MIPGQDQPSSFTARSGMFPEDRMIPPSAVSDQQVQATASSPSMPAGVSQIVDMDIVGTVNSRKELSKQWRRTRRLIWDKCWQNMKALYDKANKANWQSTTFMPLTSKVVEVIVSNMHSSIFAPEMPIEYQTKRTDYDQVVRSTNEIIQTDFDKCQAKSQFTELLRNVCVMGTGVCEVGYTKEYEQVMIKEQQNQLPQQMSYMVKSLGIDTNAQFIPKLMLVKDYATITNCDLYDIYPEPRVPEFSKDHWVIHTTKITNRELSIGMRETDPYYKFDNVTDALLAGSGLQRAEQDPEKQTRRFSLLDYNFYSHFLDPDREHVLDTMYGLIPLWWLEPDVRNDVTRKYDAVPGCIKVVDGQYVIWKRLSPWRDGEPPFAKANYISIAEEFYGIGVAELIMGLQTEKNEIRNSRMDNINLAMNKIIAVIKDMVPSGEWKRLVSEPGAIWIVKGVDDVRKAIQQIEFGDVTKDSWMASQEVDKEAEEVTAANKVTQATGGSSQEAGGGTFRGQMLNVQQATGRWMLYARMFEWRCLMPAIRKFYQRIYQFKDLKDAQEILGGDRAQKFQFMVPEDLEKVAKLVPLGVMTMENKGVKLAQMNQFAMQWMQMPWFKGLEFARKEWIEMGNPEPDSVLFSDEEQKQYNQIHQMLLQQADQHSMMMGQGQPGQPAPGNGLVGPNGQPLPPSQGPQTGPKAGSPSGAPISGNVPGPNYGVRRPAIPARGPGASPMDMGMRPMS